MKEKYMRYDNSVLKEVQKTELEILDKIVDVCQKNNLTYMLVGGTLLGAVRHKGFIPWDDDIDIAMPREDYDRFIKIAPKSLGGEYFVHSIETDETYWLPFLKVRKNDTLFQETKEKIDAHQGIFVDIFPLDYTNKPFSMSFKIRSILIRNFMETIILKKGIYKKLKECRHPFVSFLAMPFSTKKIQKMLKKMMIKDNNCFRKYLVCFADSEKVYDGLFDIKLIKSFSNVEFEGKKYTTFADYKCYLSQLYGNNYMDLPPIEKRYNHAPYKISFDKAD